MVAPLLGLLNDRSTIRMHTKPDKSITFELSSPDQAQTHRAAELAMVRAAPMAAGFLGLTDFKSVGEIAHETLKKLGKDSIEPLIGALGDPQTQAPAARVLREITGKQFFTSQAKTRRNPRVSTPIVDQKAWQKWWEENKEDMLKKR